MGNSSNQPTALICAIQTASNQQSELIVFNISSVKLTASHISVQIITATQQQTTLKDFKSKFIKLTDINKCVQYKMNHTNREE